MQHGEDMKNTGKEFDFFDRPQVRKGLWVCLYAACALSVVLEVLVHRHGHFHIDESFAFYALLGFLSCAIMILAAKGLGFILKAREDYYDDGPS